VRASYGLGEYQQTLEIIENEAWKDSKNIKNENVERFGGVSGIARFQ
jgi:hypothetical protein